MNTYQVASGMGKLDQSPNSLNFPQSSYGNLRDGFPGE